MHEYLLSLHKRLKRRAPLRNIDTRINAQERELGKQEEETTIRLADCRDDVASNWISGAKRRIPQLAIGKLFEG